MIKQFQLLKAFFSLSFALISLPQISRAGHYGGAELTYLCVAPHIYVVTGKVYRDCSGSILNTSENLQIKSPGCNNGRSVGMPLIPGQLVALPDKYYCPSAASQAQCNGSASLPNIETGIYRATITFTAAEQNCSNWYLSLSLSGKPTIENLVNAQGSNLYVDAYIKLGNTINNNSPEFSPYFNAMPFVCVNQDNSIAINTADIDGDSLSYELTSPLNDFNSPIPYAVNNNSGGGLPPINVTTSPFINPTTGQCTIINLNVAPSCSLLYKTSFFDPRPLPYQTAIIPSSFCNGGNPGGGGAYSANNPLRVGGLGIDWITNCQTNVQATSSGFNIDPLTGVIRFKPSVFHVNSPSVAGRNKYAVAVQVNEWRKINGVMTKIGHVRRDFIVLVNACNTILPTVSISRNNTPAGTSLFPDTVFSVFACATTSFTLKHQDANTADLLQVSFPDANQAGNNFIFPAIPGLVMKPFTNNQNQISVKFYITPTPNMIGQNYYLRHVVTDNACPMKGRQEMVYRIYVKGNNRLSLAGPRDRTIPLGQSSAININLLRPDSMMVSNVFGPAAYSYLWTETNAGGGLPNGLNPADQNKKNIVVTPTQTTRYFLSVLSQIAGCRDTTSVIVRIGSPNGVSGIKQSVAGFSVYPNPFTNQVHFKINLSKKADYQLIIYNLLGQETDRISLKAMPAGEQIIKWENAPKNGSGQFIARLIGSGGEIKMARFTRL